MAEITEIDGLWWPADDTAARRAALEEVGPARGWLLLNNERWGVLVQAGGNAGVYPLRLADLFETIISAEPHKENFRCLAANTRHVPNITAYNVAFGEKPYQGSMVEEDPTNAGAHRVGPGTGVIVTPIDYLKAQADVIWLDIEGYELQALKGAERTIIEHHPLIILELKNLGRHYGYTDQDVYDWLEARGYREIGTLGNDKMFRWDA